MARTEDELKFSIVDFYSMFMVQEVIIKLMDSYCSVSALV